MDHALVAVDQIEHLEVRYSPVEAFLEVGIVPFDVEGYFEEGTVPFGSVECFEAGIGLEEYLFVAEYP